MTKIKIDLLSREDFGKLPLGAKNEYLQDAARRIATAQGAPEPEPLDKESLSRLRRFYGRRRLSDLQLEQTNDPVMKRILGSLGEAIHLGEVQQVIIHETPRSKEPLLRDAPDDDAQLMFFVPTVVDTPVKDDWNLMDVAPFSLSKQVRYGTIRYQLKDCMVDIEGGSSVGIASIFDYDIIIHAITHLHHQMQQYREAAARGLRPDLPPRVYRPTAAEILKFCRREQGGRQYDLLEPALNRLLATTWKITNLDPTNNKRRATEAFSLISRYKIISRTKAAKPDVVEIEIPEWMYEGVVTPEKSPSILTLNPNYFLISRPIAKFIYKLARKAAGKSGIAEYGLETLHYRSGSTMPFAKFKAAVEEIVEDTKTTPLPDFDIAILDGKGGQKLRMTARKTLPAKPDVAALMLEVAEV